MTLLLHHPSHSALARRVVEADHRIELGEIAWNRFPDRYPDLMVGDAESLRGRDVALLASFDDPGELFGQLGVLYALPRFGVRSLVLVLPYAPTATMERVDREGRVATAMTMARLLSATPLTRTGPAEIVVFDLHSPGVRFYFGDSVRPRLLSAVSLLRREIVGRQVTIAFPDEGAQKRFGQAFSDLPQIRCHKVRRGDARIVTLAEGDPTGRDVVLVDDLVQSGGTLLEAAACLRAAGARSVSAFATHGVFPGDSWRRFRDQPLLDSVWITDSCPATAAAVADVHPFRILTLGPAIAAAIAPSEPPPGI